MPPALNNGDDAARVVDGVHRRHRGGGRGALAIAAYEVCDPRFRSMIVESASLDVLAHGLWFEGPVWFADRGELLVSDIPNDRILRITDAGDVSVFRAPAHFPNGHARDREGRLVGCSHGLRAVLRTELDGCVTVLADRYRGRRLNSPNDVVVDAHGAIWFTDPTYGIETDWQGSRAASETPAAVYRLDPVSGSLDVVADDIVGPNGIAFSPDGARLYVSETGDQFAATPVRHIRVYDVRDARGGGARSRLAHGRVFHTVSPGDADGLRCDEDGNLWTSAGDGVHAIDPSGALLGRVTLPGPVANLCFGGRHRSTLFVCAGHTLFSLAVNRRGALRP